MKEIQGNLWDYLGGQDYFICITTNGTLTKDGCLVMGRGCALEAVERFPGLDVFLGESRKKRGLVAGTLRELTGLTNPLFIFPVKDHWRHKARVDLIVSSAKKLAETARQFAGKTFILPRPGCGAGGLRWEDVKPLVEKLLPDNVWVISPAQ